MLQAAAEKYEEKNRSDPEELKTRWRKVLATFTRPDILRPLAASEKKVEFFSRATWEGKQIICGISAAGPYCYVLAGPDLAALPYSMEHLSAASQLAEMKVEPTEKLIAEFWSAVETIVGAAPH